MTRVFATLCACLLTLAAHAQPQFNWAHGVGSIGEDGCTGMDVDASGNVYTAGYFSNTVDFDPGAGTALLTAVGNLDMYFAKYDSSGNFLWVKQVGGANNEMPSGVALDPAGNPCITGGFNTFSLGVDFDPGPGTALLYADSGTTFLAKYDTNGNYIWAESFGGSQSGGSCIAVDEGGNIVVGGKFKTGLDNVPADFDPGPGFAYGWSITISSVYFARYNSSGDFLWVNEIAYPFTGQGVEIGDLSVDGSNNVYVVGSYSGNVVIGATALLPASMYKLYLAKCDSQGGVMWAYGFNDAQSISYDWGNDVACDDSGNVYITGEFGSPIDFDPGPDTAIVYPFGIGGLGGPTCFTARFNTDGTLAWAESIDFANEGGGAAVDVDECGSAYVLTKSGIALLKYGYNGDLMWQSNLAAVSPYAMLEKATLKTSPNGHFNIAGSLSGAADFDPGPGTDVVTPDSLSDILVASYDNNGLGPVIGANSYCYGDTVTYTVAPVAGATSYIWTLPTGWSGASTSNTVTAVATSGGTVTVEAVNGCNASPQSFNATASTQSPAIPQIYGDTLTCNEDFYWYTAVSDSGVTYDWSYPSDWYATIGDYGNDLVDSIGLYVYSNGVLSVTASNGCVSAPQILDIAHFYSPIYAAPPQFTSGANQLCAGATELYHVSYDSSLVTVDFYTWTLPSGWSGSSLTDSITVVAGNNSGSITVLANNACGVGPAQTLGVTVGTVDTFVTASAGTLTSNVAGATYQWFDCASGNTLSETNQTYNPTVTGTYAVIVIQDGCSDTSGCHTVIVNSVSATTSNATANVYPNPSFGTFTVEFAKAQVHNVEVSDMVGRCVYRNALSPGTRSLQIHLPDTGIYSLNITDDLTTTAHKVIVLRQP